MRILYIHQYFKTPAEGGSIRSYILAKGLVNAGHEVVMITAHNQPKKIIKKIDGIEVHYLPISYDNKYSKYRRILSFARYVFSAYRVCETIENVDFAYVMTTPLSTGLIALWIKAKLGIPYYFEVGDLWPEAPKQMKLLRNPFLLWIAYKFERKVYADAEKIIALSPPIRDYIEKKVKNAKIYLIPNIADCTFFSPRYELKNFDRKNPFQITYCGALGKANHSSFLLCLAQSIQDNNLPIHFNIMGNGSDLSKIKKGAKELSTITIHAHAGKDEVRKLLNKSDAMYISFKDVPILNTGSPNKFFDSLAAGKLTIINFEGWIAEILEKNKCGFHHSPHRPEEFITRLMPFILSKDKLHEYQKNARKLGEKFFDKEIQIAKLLNVINNEHKAETRPHSYILTA